MIGSNEDSDSGELVSAVQVDQYLRRRGEEDAATACLLVSDFVTDGLYTTLGRTIVITAILYLCFRLLLSQHFIVEPVFG